MNNVRAISCWNAMKDCLNGLLQLKEKGLNICFDVIIQRQSPKVTVICFHCIIKAINFDKLIYFSDIDGE